MGSLSPDISDGTFFFTISGVTFLPKHRVPFYHTPINTGITCNLQALRKLDTVIDPSIAATAFANITNRSHTKAVIALLISPFQDLIFQSLCVVLEHHGYPKKDIDQVMRIRSTISKPKNLKKIASRGAMCERGHFTIN